MLQQEETMTPDEQLFHAAKIGNTKAAQSAIDAGADVNARDVKRCTPLHYAAETGCLASVALLIKGGADANAKDVSGLTPSDFAIFEDHAEVATDHAEIVTALKAAPQTHDPGFGVRVRREPGLSDH